MTSWVEEFLRCADCGSPLRFDEGISCGNCPSHDFRNRDLRLRADRAVQMTFNRRMDLDVVTAIAGIDTTPPRLTYSGPKAIRNSTELMSEVSLRLPSGGRVLDLGCGPRDQAAPLEHLGFDYVGVDYSNTAADYLADAHALPFTDATFDCVFSYAVLEHLHNPFVAFAEVCRVLKPGGWFIGTVSQGEPFHDSYFHHTPWALLSIGRVAPEMTLMRLWECYDTLAALASMGRYPRVIKSLIATVGKMNSAFPWLAPRRMKWSEKTKCIDGLYRAGSVGFAFRKICAESGVRSVPDH